MSKRQHVSHELHHVVNKPCRKLTEGLELFESPGQNSPHILHFALDACPMQFELRNDMSISVPVGLLFILSLLQLSHLLRDLLRLGHRALSELKRHPVVTRVLSALDHTSSRFRLPTVGAFTSECLFSKVVTFFTSALEIFDS
jgi:hypothetical protein